MKRLELISALLFGFLPYLSAQLTVKIADSTNISCNGENNGSATISISGGEQPYEISWDDDSLSTSETAQWLVADRTYRVRVTDNLNAEAYASVLLSQPEPLRYTLKGYKTVLCGPLEAAWIKVEANGGNGEYEYTWTGATESGSDSLSGLVTGRYYFEIKDQLSCTLFDSLDIDDPVPVLVMADSIVSNPCLGGNSAEIYVEVSGGREPYRYFWEGPQGFTSSSKNITGLKEGQYSLLVTDINGCEGDFGTVLADQDAIKIEYSTSDFNGFNLQCNKGSNGWVNIDTVSGLGKAWKDYTYIWSGPDDFRYYKKDISEVPAGSYFLQVIDSANCRSYQTIVLDQPPPIAVHWDSVISNPCRADQPGAIYISVSDGYEPYSYSWTGPDGFTSQQQNITNLSKGSYSVEVTDIHACLMTGETSLILFDNMVMELEISSFGDYQVSCSGSNDGSIKIRKVNGFTNLDGFSFSTSGPDGYLSKYRYMYNMKAGNYLVSVVDPYGCLGNENVELTQPAAVVTGNISGKNIVERYDTTRYELADPVASSTYQWTAWKGEVITGQGTATPEVKWWETGIGKLSVIETNQNGCNGTEVSFQVRIDFVLGRQVLENNNALSLYPNPVQETVYLELQGYYPDKVVEIYTIQGQMIRSSKAESEIDLHGLAPGSYYLLLKTGGGKILGSGIIQKQ